MANDRQQTSAIEVESYAGYRAEESPHRFFIGHRKIEVSEIIDRWLDPGPSHFKLRGDNGGIYILRYDQASDVWEMIMFDNGTKEEPRLSST